MKNKKKKNNSSKKKPKDAENSALRVRVALRAVRWGGAAIGAVSLPTCTMATEYRKRCENRVQRVNAETQRHSVNLQRKRPCLEQLLNYRDCEICSAAQCTSELKRQD